MDNYDIEKTRVDYVQTMEIQVRHLQTELDKYKAIAEKWEPRFTAQSDAATQMLAIGLEFGGKRANVKVSENFLHQMDATGATSELLHALINGLVKDQLHAVLKPIVERAQKNVNSVGGAGQW